jgi:hypothetical protein
MKIILKSLEALCFVLFRLPPHNLFLGRKCSLANELTRNRTAVSFKNKLYNGIKSPLRMDRYL